MARFPIDAFRPELTKPICDARCVVVEAPRDGHDPARGLGVAAG